MPRTAIAELDGSGMFTFQIYCQIVSQGGCSILHSTCNVWGIQFLCILDNSGVCHSVLFYTLAILIGVYWHLVVALICISVMAVYVEHLFSVYLPFVYPLMKSFSVFCPFPNWIIWLLPVDCWVLPIFWILVLYHICALQKLSPTLSLVFPSY